MQGMKTRSRPQERPEECKDMEPRARSLSPVVDRGSPIIQFFMNEKGILHSEMALKAH